MGIIVEHDWSESDRGLFWGVYTTGGGSELVPSVRRAAGRELKASILVASRNYTNLQ